MNNPLNVDTSGLRNRLNQTKVDKENKSDNEFEFEEPSLLSTNDADSDVNNCKNEDNNIKNESINLIDLETDLNAEYNVEKVKKQVKSEPVKRSNLNTSNTKFGADNNFRFNFQMPKIISTPDKVDENSDNFFLDSVHTPSKRLQAEDNTDNKHKKARLADNNCQPNWTLITMATFSITLIFAVVKIFLILWRNEYLS